MIERERKFLVDVTKLENLSDFDETVPSVEIASGYFTEPSTGVAIRVTLRDNKIGKICIKIGRGIERDEFEYSIPTEDANALLYKCPTMIVKIRYDYAGWEIDQIFIPAGNAPVAQDPLWVAEYEEHEGKPPLTVLPDWVTREVTDDMQFTMQGLAWSHGKKD